MMLLLAIAHPLSRFLERSPPRSLSGPLVYIGVYYLGAIMYLFLFLFKKPISLAAGHPIRLFRRPVSIISHVGRGGGAGPLT